MDEELEGLELDVLRRQALNTITPKKRSSSRRHHHSTKELESEFGIDKLLSATDKFRSSPRKARRIPIRRGRSTPELSREVIETFSGRPRKPRHSFSPRPERRYPDRHAEPPQYTERGRPVHKKAQGKKQQHGRRRSLASSSRSSYSSSSGSRSHSSYSSSRSSSHSSSTSASPSFSRSQSSTSGSYSRSSYSSSSESRSVTPERRPPKEVERHDKKKRTLPHSYRDDNHEERQKKSKRVSSPTPPRHKKLKASAGSPERDWYHQQSLYERRGPYETPHDARMRSPPPDIHKMRPPPPAAHKMRPPSPELHTMRPLHPGDFYRDQDRPSKRRPPPHSPSEYHEGDDYYHSSDRRADYPPGRPRGPRPPSPGEGRIVRRIAGGRFPSDRPRPPPRDCYRDGRGPYRRGPPPLSPPPPLGRRGGYIPHSRGGKDFMPERERMRHSPPERRRMPLGRDFPSVRERVRYSPSERGRMDRELTPEGERVRRSLPRNRTGRERTPERERERERVKRSPPGQFIRRPAWEEEHRIQRHPQRERIRHHSDEENEQRSPIKSTVKTPHKTSKRAASVSTAEEPSELKKTKHGSEDDLKRKPSKTQKKEEKPAKVSESSSGDPVPQMPQEESSDSSNVNRMPIHEDISPQKEEVETVDDKEVDEISDVVDSSFLMGTLEEEELDYDENMDDLDLHPTGTLDDGDSLTVPTEEMAPKGKEERNSHTRKRKKIGREDSSSESEVPDSGSEFELQQKRHKSTHNSISSSSNHEGGGTPIRSPIRVSPSRKEPRLVRETQSTKYSRSDSSKLSVKERLYVSKKTIEEKKRRIQYQDEPPASLRPSLANRLGPSPYGGSRNRSFIDFPRHSSRGMGRGPLGPPKGDAFEIAEAYKRKKRQEMLREEDVTKAKNITKIINEPDSKPTTKKVKAQEEEGEKERALDKRIDEIKAQNKAIMKRKSEIEMDKELYG